MVMIWSVVTSSFCSFSYLPSFFGHTHVLCKKKSGEEVKFLQGFYPSAPASPWGPGSHPVHSAFSLTSSSCTQELINKANEWIPLLLSLSPGECKSLMPIRSFSGQSSRGHAEASQPEVPGFLRQGSLWVPQAGWGLPRLSNQLPPLTRPMSGPQVSNPSCGSWPNMISLLLSRCLIARATRGGIVLRAASPLNSTLFC